jgi:formylglycine-generating enzyme required for sulfatase activity
VRGVFEKIHAIQADYPDRDGLLAAAEGELEKTDLYHKSLEAMGRREWAQAVEDLERLVKIDPAYPQAKDLLERARAEQRATIGPAKKQNEIELELAPGVTLALVRVPAGSFTMGSSDEDGMAYGDEKPQHTVELSEYWIGRYPVTVAQFAAFVKASGHKTTAEEQGEGYVWPPGEYVKGANWQHPHGPDSDVKGKDDHPVTQVSWSDAAAFCQWVSQVTGHEMRLPSEAEWEKAARGTDGRLYPWGNEKPDEVRCNFNQNVKDTTAVGKYSPQGDSPYGCAEMAGNVWEWCHDWFDEWEYARRAEGPAKDPPGPASGSSRVLRGGAWLSFGRYLRCACRYRNEPINRDCSFGFRLACFP